MRILIIDDEPLSRSYLLEQLSEIDGVEVLGQATNGFEAVKQTEDLKPDLLLLDVQMPKLSGFEVLELLGERAPAVIFVTAHDRFALRAFAVHAVDYLLKPVEPARLKEAIDRARTRIGQSLSSSAVSELAAAARAPGQSVERVLIRQNEQVHVLPVHRIDYIEAQDDYLSIAADGKRFRKQQTLAQIESQLDAARFLRVHRSYIVNVERITRIEPYGKDSWVAVMKDGARVSMSSAGYQRLKAVFKHGAQNA